MNKKEVFIHVGLGRSGSDFLQKKIFSKISNINYIDRYNSKNFDKFRIDLFYNPFFDSKKHNFSFKSKTLISSEGFFNPEYKLYELKNKIQHIARNPKIILILREPFSHLISTYKYSVKRGNLWRNIDEYFDFNCTRRARNMSQNTVFYQNFYNYDILINYLKANFDNVSIFKFEKIFKSYETMIYFLNTLEKKFKFKFKEKLSKKNFNKINSSFSDEELKKKRILNFKKENYFITSRVNKSSYFKNYYSLKFKRKFLNLLNFDYEKLI